MIGRHAHGTPLPGQHRREVPVDSASRATPLHPRGRRVKSGIDILEDIMSDPRPRGRSGW